jgi:hypothetical protein
MGIWIGREDILKECPGGTRLSKPLRVVVLTAKPRSNGGLYGGSRFTNQQTLPTADSTVPPDVAREVAVLQKQGMRDVAHQLHSSEVQGRLRALAPGLREASSVARPGLGIQWRRQPTHVQTKFQAQRKDDRHG